MANVKLLSWNIQHGGGSRVDALTRAIDAHVPDIAVLTEFRCGARSGRLSAALSAIGLVYQTHPHVAACPNTVVVAARRPFESHTFEQLQGDAARCIEVRIAEMTVMAVYFPQGRAKRRLFDFLLTIPREGRTLIVGDFNTGKHFIDEQGSTFICADAFTSLEAVGWIDAWRRVHGSRRDYSWFSRAGNGFRIDHLFVTAELAQLVRAVDYSHEERLTGISDHSALIATIG